MFGFRQIVLICTIVIYFYIFLSKHGGVEFIMPETREHKAKKKLSVAGTAFFNDGVSKYQAVAFTFSILAEMKKEIIVQTRRTIQ